jgi:hypothetical protein
MAMLKILHLFNFSKGSRYHSMISQGLFFHKNISACYAMPFISLGTIVKKAEENLMDAASKADYILRCNDEHFGFTDVDKFLDINNYWKKVVYYDKKDSPAIDTKRLETCAAYIKRSWTKGFDRKERPPLPRPVLPLDFSLLSEYFHHKDTPVKDIDTAYLFPRVSDFKKIGRRRFNVLVELTKEKESLGNAIIGCATAGARHGRRAIFDPPANNPFLEYIRILKRSRIIFTAYPDEWDGDSRTWEAFSSGALVFMDASFIPSPYPMIHGRHCFIYDARNFDSIKKAIDTAKYYLKNEGERKAIADEGFRYACEHHHPVNRMDQILKWVESPDRILSEHVDLTLQEKF